VVKARALRYFGRAGIWIVTGIAIVILTYLCVGYVTDRSVDSAVSAVKKENAIRNSRGCARNQLPRAYLILRATEVDSATAAQAADTFQILWCERTYALHRSPEAPAVFLPVTASDCFLDLFKRGWWGDPSKPGRHEPFTDPTRLNRLCRAIL
jgi:hypothetical protein